MPVSITEFQPLIRFDVGLVDDDRSTMTAIQILADFDFRAFSVFAVELTHQLISDFCKIAGVHDINGRILVCSQDFHEEDYRDLVDSFEQVEMSRSIGGNDLKAIKAVRALIKKYNPDIVYAHSSKAGAIARVADIGLKNRCVYNPHGWAFNMRCSAKKKAMYTAIEKIAAPCLVVGDAELIKVRC